MNQIRKVAVMTSGGDAPGMNAAIRAAVRMAIYRQLEVVGVIGGYTGILNGQFQPMQLRSVANIIQRGGTILKTARCLEFHKPEYRKIAADKLRAEGIDALICIGGDGSFRGAHLLNQEHGIKVVGVPGTIDNDIYGSDNTIGFDTAVNIALDAIDRIRDTAASHDRLFIVEVMGRNSGFIATEVGLAGGAEIIFTPEHLFPIDQAVNQIKTATSKGKMSSILIAAEGQKPGRAYDLAEAIRKKSGFEAKVCILGHIQRGGSPTAKDRILASRLGAGAVDALLSGDTNCMIGVINDKIVKVPFHEVYVGKKEVPRELIDLAQILSL
jgi:6-phosphofructokinase 1